MISLPVVTGKGTTPVINIPRRGKDYDERDRLILNMIQPHYDQAIRRIQRLEALAGKQARSLATYGLSPRELEIARWLAGGKSNPEIAIILQGKVRTVEKHVENILGKLGVENRTAAAVMITQCGRFSK